MKNKKIFRIGGGRIPASALTFSLLLAGCTAGDTPSSSSQAEKAAESASSAGGNSPGTTALPYAAQMDKTKIMTFAIAVDAESWQTMLDNAQKEEYISADVTINGTTVQNVGIRPKGNSSLSSIARDNTTDRYSFKIKFDEYVDSGCRERTGKDGGELYKPEGAMGGGRMGDVPARQGDGSLAAFDPAGVADSAETDAVSAATQRMDRPVGQEGVPGGGMPGGNQRPPPGGGP